MARTAAFRPETILLDIGLPGTNGYEVALRDGFDAHLVTPMNPAELRKILGR